jgi:hypothetical protein
MTYCLGDFLILEKGSQYQCYHNWTGTGETGWSDWFWRHTGPVSCLRLVKVKAGSIPNRLVL